LDKKLSGVFEHKVYNHKNPIFRGFDDVFYAPHSRHSTLLKEDVLKHDELEVISEGDQCGVYMVMGRGGREFYILGHPEYSPNTLDFEYKRDLGLGLNPHIPDNYYEGNNPENEVIVRWRSHANLLYSNWLNYFVYQETPYDIRNIK
jgi:homoserine O-succinyltransferase